MFTMFTMDQEFINFSFSVFFALLAIMNPPATIFIFVSALETLSSQEKRIVAIEALSFSLLLVLIFAIFGYSILDVFGVRVGAFKIAGGILLFSIGYELLQGELSRFRLRSYQKNSDSIISQSKSLLSISITPIAFPVIVGPGTIVTVLHYVDQSKNFLYLFAIVFIFASICFALYLILHFEDYISKWIGKTMIRVASQIMGFIVIMIAIDMIIGGLISSFPILTS